MSAAIFAFRLFSAFDKTGRAKRPMAQPMAHHTMSHGIPALLCMRSTCSSRSAEGKVKHRRFAGKALACLGLVNTCRFLSGAIEPRDSKSPQLVCLAFVRKATRTPTSWVTLPAKSSRARHVAESWSGHELFRVPVGVFIMADCICVFFVDGRTSPWPKSVVIGPYMHHIILFFRIVSTSQYKHEFGGLGVQPPWFTGFTSEPTSCPAAALSRRIQHPAWCPCAVFSMCFLVVHW